MERSDRRSLILLRDLLCRCYVVTSIKERSVVREICVIMYRIHPGHDDESVPVDTEDSRSVADAYSQSILSSTDQDPHRAMMLDMHRYLLEFVCDIASSVAHEQLPLVARAAVERFWIAFDSEKLKQAQSPDGSKSQIRYYAGDLVYHIP
jgi:hypothetical protein